MVGLSDPVSFKCTCKAQELGGSILLFYRYFAAPPTLPQGRVNEVQELFDFQQSLCTRLQLTGKIRIASEGFNVTVGGTRDEIASYIEECVQHWSFAGLRLDTVEERNTFFKPSSDGCSCAFEKLSIKMASEITPLGITNYTPKEWGVVQSLTPAEFHEKCWERGEKRLVDVRNHYESRIGYFVDPVSGEKAIRPEVRRFSQFPQYVKTHFVKEIEELQRPANLLTYCTGGIRCEKSVRWMAERLQPRDGQVVCTLKGGIAAYLTWMDEEIRSGRKTSVESLFKGRNYVFDGRGSTGLSSGEMAPVSTCIRAAHPRIGWASVAPKDVIWYLWFASSASVSTLRSAASPVVNWILCLAIHDEPCALASRQEKPD